MSSCWHLRAKADMYLIPDIFLLLKNTSCHAGNFLYWRLFPDMQLHLPMPRFQGKGGTEEWQLTPCRGTLEPGHALLPYPTTLSMLPGRTLQRAGWIWNTGVLLPQPDVDEGWQSPLLIIWDLPSWWCLCRCHDGLVSAMGKLLSPVRRGRIWLLLLLLPGALGSMQSLNWKATKELPTL